MAVPRRLTLSLDRLVAQFEKPRPPGGAELRHAGPLAGWESPRPAEALPGRWLTLVTYGRGFLVLVDEFRGLRPQPFSFLLRSERPLRAKSRTVLTTTGRRDPLAIHLLGDYSQQLEPRSVTLTQKLSHGRFLLALTRDLETSVRGLNGWAMEFRSAGRVVHLLHTNRSTALRPLGPIKTDARFAATEWSAAEGFSPIGFGASVHLIGARRFLWGQNGELSSTSPLNLTITDKPPTSQKASIPAVSSALHAGK